MSDFRVDRYEKLDPRPIGEALQAVRSVPGNRLLDEDAYRDIAAMRDDDEGGVDQ
jgi:hypothetical protein